MGQGLLISDRVPTTRHLLTLLRHLWVVVQWYMSCLSHIAGLRLWIQFFVYAVFDSQGFCFPCFFVLSCVILPHSSK